MKILQLCKKFPYPLKDGESIAVASLSRSLHELGCEVSLLAMNTQKHFFSENGALPSEMSHYKEALKVPVDNRVTPGGAFLNLFSRESYHISRFVSSDFSSRLVQLLKANSYDLIQLETPYLAP